MSKTVLLQQDPIFLPYYKEFKAIRLNILLMMMFLLQYYYLDLRFISIIYYNAIIVSPCNTECFTWLSYHISCHFTVLYSISCFPFAVPSGSSTIRRSSTQSSVTIPYERTFRSQGSRPGDPGSVEAAEFDFCGCGWPHHLLLPKGTTRGYPVVLFCMISNWNNDGVSIIR